MSFNVQSALFTIHYIGQVLEIDVYLFIRNIKDGHWKQPEVDTNTAMMNINSNGIRKQGTRQCQSQSSRLYYLHMLVMFSTSLC